MPPVHRIKDSGLKKSFGELKVTTTTGLHPYRAAISASALKAKINIPTRIVDFLMLKNAC
jgi:hypothetical protein